MNEVEYYDKDEDVVDEGLTEDEDERDWSLYEYDDIGGQPEEGDTW